MQETWVRSLGQENPQKELTTCSSSLLWEIPWTEVPEGMQPMGSQRVGYDWATVLMTEVSRWFIPSYSLLIWLVHSFCLSQTPCCHLFISDSWINSYFPFIHTLYSMKFQLCLLGKVDISKSKLGAESDGESWSRGQSGGGMKVSRSVRFMVGHIYLHLQMPSASLVKCVLRPELLWGTPRCS